MSWRRRTSARHDGRPMYESPFTDFDGQGVEGVFAPADVVRLVDVLREIDRNAA